MRSISQAATDVGRKRSNNEDAFFADDAIGLYAVADGVGGHAAGEVASALFVEAVKASSKRFAKLVEAAAGRPDLQRETFLGFVSDVFQNASEAIYGEAHHNPSRRGMMTTGVLVALRDGYAMIGHVGDSRAYLVRGGKALQLTTDHTVAQELIDTGVLKPDQLADFAYKSVLSRAIGKLPNVKVDTLFLDARPGDRFFLCTDGFAQYFDLAGVEAMAERGAQAAISAANDAGGSDNVTVVLAEVSGSRAHTQTIDTNTRIVTLGHIFLFRGLNQQELMRTLKIVHEQTCAEGEPLVREGDAGDRFYVVVDGALAVVKGGLVLAELEVGDTFGEQAFMDTQPRSASVVARVASTVLWIQREDFVALSKEEPRIATKLLSSLVVTLSERLRSTSEEMVTKGSRRSK